MSFWKQDPPNPTEVFKNFGPILLSVPNALATSSTLAPVASHNAEMELIEDILWAKNAFAVSLDNSEDHTLVVKILCLGIHLAYISTSLFAASIPSCVWFEPIKTLSDWNKSSIAVPSAKNSGLDNTWKFTFSPVESRMVCIVSAVLTGNVDFSTIILSVFDILAICLAQSSTYFKSAAIPLPWPYVFVGVLTAIKIISDSSIALSTSVEKNKFLPLASETTFARPGSNTGKFSKFVWFHKSIFSWFISTTVTLISGHFRAITAIVGPPT